jgi:broad specificity phosphatase PhoE
MLFPTSPLRALVVVWLVLAVLLAAPASAAPPLPLGELAKPGRVLMLRHANAPGIGDPPGFRIDDCSTQRQLDAVGRAQAVALGKRLAAAGVTRARVWSSQWCRCLETARLLGVGDPVELPALNSFFGRAETGESRVAELRRFLATLPADGPAVIMVTHQVTITALTGEAIAVGAGALFELGPGGSLRLVGETAPN